MDDQQYQPVTPEPVVPPPIEPVAETANSGHGWRDVISTVLILVSAPLIALLLTAYVFQSYEVDGPAIRPAVWACWLKLFSKTSVYL